MNTYANVIIDRVYEAMNQKAEHTGKDVLSLPISDKVESLRYGIINQNGDPDFDLYAEKLYQPDSSILDEIKDLQKLYGIGSQLITIETDNFSAGVATGIALAHDAKDSKSYESKPSIGNNIKKLRKEKLMSQDDLSEKTGISCSYISAIENGEATDIKISMLLNLANALDTTVQDLYQADKQGKLICSIHPDLDTLYFENMNEAEQYIELITRCMSMRKGHLMDILDLARQYADEDYEDDYE